MLHNESPVYYHSVVTSVLNDGSFCWGAFLGVCGAQGWGGCWESVSFSMSLLSRVSAQPLVSLSGLVAEHTSCAVQVTKIPDSSFSEESLEERWTCWKESRKSLTRVCEQGAWVQLACVDFSGMNEKPGMLPGAILLVTLLEKASDRIIKEMVFAW